MNWKETLNPYMSTEEATFYRRFLHILKHFLIVIVGGAFFTRIVSHSFLFDHLYNPDICTTQFIKDLVCIHFPRI